MRTRFSPGAAFLSSRNEQEKNIEKASVSKFSTGKLRWFHSLATGQSH